VSYWLRYSMSVYCYLLTWTFRTLRMTYILYCLSQSSQTFIFNESQRCNSISGLFVSLYLSNLTMRHLSIDVNCWCAQLTCQLNVNKVFNIVWECFRHSESMKTIMVAIEGEMMGRKDFPIIFVEVSLDFRNGIEFPILLYRKLPIPHDLLKK